MPVEEVQGRRVNAASVTAWPTLCAFLLGACSADLPHPAPEEHLIPLNLDFAIAGLAAPEIPWGWSFQGLSAVGIEHRVIDGSGVLELRREDDGGDGVAIYDLAAPFPGSALELSASVSGATGSTAGIRVGVTSLRSDWSLTEARSNWRGDGVVTARMAIPQDSQNVQLVVEYRGAGGISLGGLRLAFDGEVAGSDLPGQSSPGPEIVAWVREQSIPLATTDPRGPLNDLGALDPLVGDAKLILLGESTHGTSEFFQLKHRVVRWLMSRGDRVVFVIEDHPDKADLINHFIETGEGDPVTLVNGLFGFWSRRETLELVTWMRAATAAGSIDAAFTGVDLQVPTGAIAAVQHYARQQSRELAVTVETELAPMRTAWGETRYPRRSLEEYERWAASALRVSKALEKAVTEGEAHERALFDARLIWQSARVSGATDYRLRDEYMADNLAWLRERSAPGTRFVVWAHNTHIRLDEEAMGQHLEQRYPGEVLAIGLFTAQGGYVAFDGRSLGDYHLFPAPPGSLEHLLRLGPSEILALDLRDQVAVDLLSPPLLHRNIGLFPADLGFYRTSVPKGFHAILFVDSTNPTAPIEQPSDQQ